jgi:nucleotide-binding universal stress UspA family protein
VLQIVVSVVAFLVISFTLGRYLIKKILDYVQDEVISTDRLLTLVVVLTFAWGAITQALHLEAVLGAFIMGVILGQMPRLPDSVHKKLESIALGVFAPVFFAVAGLKVNVRNLLETELMILCLLVIFVACAGKIAGTYIGARFVGRRDHWTSLSFGAGLNARGAMEIIIATIGLSLGILSQDMFSIIVVMAMVTSLMAPPALRYVLRHVEPEEQEKQRLKKEELAKDSKVAAIYRVLLPVRMRDDGDNVIQTIESGLLEKMGQKSPLSVTLLTVVKPGEKAKATAFLNKLSTMFNQHEIVKKIVESENPADTILDEVEKDYDLLLLGASGREDKSDVLFSPLVDYMIRLAPCMTMVVHGERLKENWTPSRILVPTNGSVASKSAAEVGFMITSSVKDEVTILNVVEDDLSEWHMDIVPREIREKKLGYAHQIVEQLRKIGESQGVLTVADVRAGSTVEDIIVKVVEKERMDLVILGTRVRAGTEKLYMGPRVERILQRAGCPVIVVNH